MPKTQYGGSAISIVCSFCQQHQVRRPCFSVGGLAADHPKNRSQPPAGPQCVSRPVSGLLLSSLVSLLSLLITMRVIPSTAVHNTINRDRKYWDRWLGVSLIMRDSPDAGCKQLKECLECLEFLSYGQGDITKRQERK